MKAEKPMTEDPNDMLGGGTYAKFETVGTSYTGTVTRWFVDQQATNYQGDPDPCPTVWLETAEGHITLPINNGAKKFAIRKAVEDAGSPLSEGDTLTFTHTATGEASQRGHNPPKLYEASIKPGTAASSETPMAGDLI